MKYQPNRYVLQIRRKEEIPPLSPPSPLPPGFPENEPWFDSWEEAHTWLIEDRAKKVARAANALKAAERTLKRAKLMVNKEK